MISRNILHIGFWAIYESLLSSDQLLLRVQGSSVALKLEASPFGTLFHALRPHNLLSDHGSCIVLSAEVTGTDFGPLSVSRLAQIQLHPETLPRATPSRVPP